MARLKRRPDARVKARNRRKHENSKAPRDGETQEDADARVKAWANAFKEPKAGETRENADARVSKTKQRKRKKHFAPKDGETREGANARVKDRDKEDHAKQRQREAAGEQNDEEIEGISDVDEATAQKIISEATRGGPAHVVSGLIEKAWRDGETTKGKGEQTARRNKEGEERRKGKRRIEKKQKL